MAAAPVLRDQDDKLRKPSERPVSSAIGTIAAASTAKVCHSTVPIHAAPVHVAASTSAVISTATEP